MKKTVFIFLLALLCGTARAQGSAPLVKIFESERGVQPAQIFNDGTMSLNATSSLLDANGDGTPDLILTRVDDDGILQAIRVVSGFTGAAGPHTLWEVQDVPQMLGITDGTDHVRPVAFFGFADFDADGKPEAIFADTLDVVLINPTDNSLVWSCSNTLIQMGADPNCLLVGITDLTGDDFPDLVVKTGGVEVVVQVWSRAQ